jgi:hypothetical protein
MNWRQCAAEGRSWRFGLYFLLVRLHWEETVITLRGGWKVCSVMRILRIDWAFGVGLRKGTKHLEPTGRTQNLPDAHWLLAYRHTNRNVRQSLCLWKRTNVTYTDCRVCSLSWGTDGFTGRKKDNDNLKNSEKLLVNPVFPRYHKQQCFVSRFQGSNLLLIRATCK